MTTGFMFGFHRGIILSLFILTALSAIFVLRFQTRSSASDGTAERVKSRILPNYDIRSDKAAAEKLTAIRSLAGRSAAEVADARDAMVRGEESLRQRVPTLKVEYNTDLMIPELIGPDVKQGRAFLSRTSKGKRSTILRNFLRENAELVGAHASQIDKLKVAADYTNPDGNLSFVALDQELNGIPVFRGEIKAGFTRKGELIRVINNSAPGLDGSLLSTDFGDPTDAVNAASLSIDSSGSKLNVSIDQKRSSEVKMVFGKGDSATTAEKMYFPTEPGVAVPAWRVLVWRPADAYYVIVDARDGTVLWRKNITEDQTQPATYSVYANGNAMVNVANSPFPFSPGPVSPNGAQGTPISRTSVTRIGNEPPYTFNNLGWIADGGTTTDGNAVQAGLDRDGTDGIDPNGEAASATRDFTFSFNPLNPNTNTGDNPISVPQLYPGSQFQQGIVTQLFYVCNWFHDETYRLGFTEAARNFQDTNFTGQGAGGDRVRGEGQDSGDFNNANFSTPADGGRGRMQMYLFTLPNPDIDGSLDASVVIHEHTHGLSNRLHGNSSGLFNDMSRSLGEGWSDFYAMAMLSEPGQAAGGIHTVAAYASYMFGGSSNNNYYGIRRFPTAIRTSVGGPDNRPHNPLTFADIDATQINIMDGAFAPGRGGTSDQVHNAGEIWAATLWEIRHRMIERLGWEAGNRRVLQLVTDGMKLAPLSPTFVSERDAIIGAAFASGDAEDLADLWAGFAARGLGAGASIENVGGISIGGTGRARVTEAFDLPNLDQAPNLTADDSTGDNDGYPEPGETILLSIPLKNSTGRTATGVTLQVAGGGSANYGSLTGATTVSRQAGFAIPAGTVCGSVIELTLNVNSSLGAKSFTRQLFIGKPDSLAASEDFDGVAAPAIPAGWTESAVAGGVSFVTSPATPDTAPNSIFALDPEAVGGGTDLTSPPVSITSPSATLSFRNSYDTESGWDGGVLDISVAGAPFVDILAAGGSFVSNGYNGSLGPGTNNPVANRAAWTGNSGGYVTTVAQLPADAGGKIVQLRWRFGADNNTAETGWNIDTITLDGAGFVTSFACTAGVEVSGRVTTPFGQGVGNGSVFMIDSQGISRRVTTSSFGFYHFENVFPGQTYTIRATSKRFRFPARVVSVTGELTDVDIVGQE